MVIEHRLVATLEVIRPTLAGDGAGGQTVTLEAVGSIRAQISQPSTDERRLAAQFGVDLTHVVHTSAGADVRRGDTLEGPIPSGPSSLRVVSVVRNSRGTYSRLECEATQREG